MAGAACKIIINNGVSGLSLSLERVLTSPLVRGVMISEEQCGKYIQRLADIDLAAYDPDNHKMPNGGLVGLMEDLTADGVFTDEIWEVFKRDKSKLDNAVFKTR